MKTKFKTGDIVKLNPTIIERIRLAITDPEKIALFGELLLEENYARSKETFTVTVVKNQHCGGTSPMVTYSDGKTSILEDSMLVNS